MSAKPEADGKIFKPSRYNFLIAEDESGDVLLFNGLNSALVRLPQGIYPIVRNILLLGNLNSSSLPCEIQPLLAMFKDGGFIVDANLDELNIVRNRLQFTRESGPLHIIIAPTLDCNLDCKYCYQFRAAGIMAPEVCDQIIGFAYRKLVKGDITVMRVDWYGGEPLLALEIISYLSEHFLKLAQEFNCEYESSIATNGTLLDNKAIKLLVENKVKSCQVTVDGPKEVHDKRRGYKNDKGSSFDQILLNMKQVIGKMDLSVRINIDADNISHAYSLLDIFKQEGFLRKRILRLSHT